MKANGEIVEFLKQRDYVMINNNLGAGSFGQTVLLRDPFIDELFVAKKYEPYHESNRKEFYDSFLQEIKIMYKLNHRNVVRIYNYYPYEKSQTGYIIMEYIDEKSLPDYLEEVGFFGDFEEPDNLFVQLIDGFQYIESQGIVHRDIREGNIMVDKYGVVKIIDFGLGKTFKPIATTTDSMNVIINRSGLDVLPNEYFEGTYDSRTDMFYLAELFNRLLRTAQISAHFSYHAILQKMMARDRKDRYSSFEEIRAAIGMKDFSDLEISNDDKQIYQAFSNALCDCIFSLTTDTVYVNDIDEFQQRIIGVVRSNCFEDYIQNNEDLVSVVIRQGFQCDSSAYCEYAIVVDFRDWFEKLSIDSKRLVLNNLIAKISALPVEEAEPELPF